MNEQGRAIGGRDIPVGATYTCPDCLREYEDVEDGEVMDPCPSEDCTQHWEMRGLVHPLDM